MTVRLLADWFDSRDGRRYLANNLLTTDAGTESGLVAAKLADENLTGGTAYVKPTVPDDDTQLVRWNKNGDGSYVGINMPAASNSGFPVGLTSPAWGWRDLEGALVPKSTGAGSPALTTFRGNTRWFAYAAGDDMDAVFHVPHDYAPGTDLYLHLHWSHNGTGISGTSVINYFVSYAKGHSQAVFPAEAAITQTLSGLNMTNTPRYTHRIDEFVITSAGGGADSIDRALIEPDGLIHIHFDWVTIPTITGGAAKPFGFYLDLHYQSTGMATKNKSPNFYGTD